MKKLKIYLDTSVLNFFFADDEPVKKEITKQLFYQIERGFFSVFISTAVIEEIEKCEQPKREKLYSLVSGYNLGVIELNEEAERLGERYVNEGIIPQRYDVDALHIAIATVNDIDVVVSWNLEHMVKVKTRIEVNGINLLEGYHQIDISTPEEVIEYEH